MVIRGIGCTGFEDVVVDGAMESLLSRYVCVDACKEACKGACRAHVSAVSCKECPHVAGTCV